jgi:hypothetical protein
MAFNYPQLKQYFSLQNVDPQQVYNDMVDYAGELKFLLEQRDAQVNLAPATRFYTVVSTGEIGRPRIGDVAYTASSSQFQGFINASVGWQPFNAGGKSAGYFITVNDTTDQTATTSTSANAVSFNTVDGSFGFSLVSSTKFVADHDGVYNFQFSLQLTNDQSQAENLYVWLAKNGTNIPNSAGIATVPSTHGGKNGHMILGYNVIVTVSSSDYLELYWKTDKPSTYLETVSSLTSPAVPVSPSAIATITQV